MGGAGDDDLEGREGNDILVGGDGSDELCGGTGEDVLIGGADDDLLCGDNNGDLPVAAIWTYQADVEALDAVLKEWTRTDASYGQRRDHLTGDTPGGLNGAFVLNSTKLTEDVIKDTLQGDRGRDLFFARTEDPANDNVKDNRSNEDVVPTL